MDLLELCTWDWGGLPHSAGLSRLLRDYGANLCDNSSTIRRGTPVYVEVDADPLAVQRAMAEHRACLLFVLDRETVCGVISRLDLIDRSASIARSPAIEALAE